MNFPLLTELSLNDGTNFLLSLGAQFKPEYYSKNTDFTKYTHNIFAGGNPVGGWSSIGNPGTFLFQTDDGNANTGAYLATV